MVWNCHARVVALALLVQTVAGCGGGGGGGTPQMQQITPPPSITATLAPASTVSVWVPPSLAAQGIIEDRIINVPRSMIRIKGGYSIFTDIQARARQGSLSLTHNRVVVYDEFSSTMAMPDVDDKHGFMVKAVLENNNSGATVGAYNITFSEFSSSEAISVYTSLTEDQIINYSFGPSDPPDQYHANVTPSMIISVGAAIIIAAGNEGNSISAWNADWEGVENPAAVAAAFNSLGATGLVLWVVGLDYTDSERLHEDSNKCGLLMTFCLAAPYQVPYSTHNRDNWWRSGTSYSAPLVAGALDILRTRWPQLDNRHAISIVLESADQDLEGWGTNSTVEIHTLYGHGELNLANAFEPLGSLTLSILGNGPAVTAGELALPGLAPAVRLDAFDRYRRDYPVIERNLAVAPARRLASPDFTAFEHSPRWQVSHDPATNHPALMRTFASGTAGAYVAPNEAGLAWPRLGAVLAVARDTGFFGGHGTGSLGFGSSRYLGLRARREAELEHGSLTAGLQVAHGRARDGPLVRRLGGTMVRPSLAWARPLSSRASLELDVHAVLFRGRFELAGAGHRLAHADYGVGARVKLDF